jgi:hypothetical protein
MRNPRMLLGNSRLIVPFAAIFMCISLLMPCIGSGSDPNINISAHSGQSAANGNSIVEDVNGPTILLSYSEENLKINPVSSLMYFVPLTSQTLVDRETSANNEQQTSIISYKKKVTSGSFHVTCEFKIWGKGFHKNIFDSAGMIKANTDKLKMGESLTNMLDYIKSEGDGSGRIEVIGTMAGSVPTVTEVDLQFNARGLRSPVIVGLYDVKPKDGQYKYENRSNKVVVRVNELIFKKSDRPRMGMKIASINKTEKSDTLMGSITGLIANLFISPTEVDKLGNDTMLDFGYTLLKQEPAFTFPKARKIRTDRVVAIDDKQN